MQDDAAVATSLGLYLNCASAGLYMANYQLVIPTVSRFLQHMGVDQSAAGLVIGCCDIASIPVTVGVYPSCRFIAVCYTVYRGSNRVILYWMHTDREAACMGSCRDALH